MLKNYIKIAVRTLLKNKLSSFINITGLSIGISTCIVILIFVRYEDSFDGYHEKAEQTYRIVQHTSLPDQTLYWNTTAYPLAEALRNDFPDINLVTQTAGPMRREFSITNEIGENQKFEEPNLLFVDPFFSKTFDVVWLSGDSETAFSDLNSVVLTEHLAQKYFGVTPANYATILGKTILLQHKDPLKVTGVIENPPGNSNQQYNMLIPYEFFKVNNPYFSANWSGNYQGTTFVVLQNTNLQKGLENKLASWKKKYLKPEDDRRISYFLQPLTEIHNETLYGSSISSYTLPSTILNTASVVALFILIIGIVNFINLLTAQSTARSKEIGVRKVLGGKRRDLIFQFIFENSLVIVLTLGISIALVGFLLQLLNANLSIINLQLTFVWQHTGLVLLIGVLTIVLAAIYPAIVLSAYKPIRALKKKVQFGKTNTFNLRKSLIVFQFVIVQLFVIGAIVVALQMNYFKNGALGFTSDAIVVTPSPEFNKLDVYRNSLLADNNIAKVSFGSGPPMAVEGFQLGTNYRLPEQSSEEALEAEMKVVDVNYLDFYGLQLLAGHNFTKNKEAFDEFIVNETFLASYGWSPEEAIGKKIQINEGPATIIGVVKDFHNNSLQHEITPCILLNWTYYQNNAFVKIKNGSSATLASIESIWKRSFTKAIFNYHFLDDSIEKEYVVERLISKGFGVFSILAICIGCLGLLGLMSFLVSRKTKEVGIRKVLGANLLQVVTFFTKEFIGLIAIAFIIAVPFVYYYINIWLEGFTHRISLAPWMFMAGGLLTLGIAVLCCSFQTVKAAHANPINALKEE